MLTSFDQRSLGGRGGRPSLFFEMASQLPKCRTEHRKACQGLLVCSAFVLVVSFFVVVLLHCFAFRGCGLGVFVCRGGFVSMEPTC